ncbi:hypothetical protein [Reyranella soli]|uniref:Uncharacterized protein n=1 Tax=Reyranella soli TaxID=1230389 RepID=A0A512NJH1_9HYPH|nr:hypothetical protein [Reyranella soli]GEP59094.1 hypothetical protein RSO01_62600 [Reyranella soli]
MSRWPARDAQHSRRRPAAAHTLLLLLGRSLPRNPATEDAPLSLVPTDSLHVGPLPSGETLLAVGIGPATVGLSLPASAVEKLAHFLLAAVAKSDPRQIQ